jgi:hypothetical protein
MSKLPRFMLTHLARSFRIPAQMADDIGMVNAIDSLIGTDSREILSTGQSVLAMALNCLGFTSRPLYISPQFVPRNVKFLLGSSNNYPNKELLPEHLNEHRLGALDRIAQLVLIEFFLRLLFELFIRKSYVPMA